MASKAERIEALKKAKDGLDVWDDIHRCAEIGDYHAIDPDDLERFKWYGLYPQKPNQGHFMCRVKIPGGMLTAGKLRELGRMARQHGRNMADVTTRQDIQLHWLELGDLPDVLDRIHHKLGMYQDFSCGDAPRNVTSCPLAGRLADEIVDVGGLARAVSDMYRAGGKAFSNLPRKHKTCITGCRSHCAAPQINEIGFFGVERTRHGTVERGLGLCVGGGLRDTPHFAPSLRVFLQPDVEWVKDVCRRVVEIYRDEESLRKGRLRARLKFYVAKIGWEAFRDQLEDRLGYRLEHDDEIVGPAGRTGADHLGIGDLANGLRYVGVPVPRGRLSGDQMIRLADLAAKYGSDPQAGLCLTIKQNVLFLDVPPGKTTDLAKELADVGLPVDGHALRSQLLSCTGTQFCNLAVVETKERARRILDYLEAHVAMDEPVFVSVTGCPNSCAQYQIADVGLQGTLFTHAGQKGVEHYHLLVGGRMGADPRFARFVCGESGKKIKVLADRVHLSIERLIKAYQADRTEGADGAEGDTFADWAGGQEMSRLVNLVTLRENGRSGGVAPIGGRRANCRDGAGKAE